MHPYGSQSLVQYSTSQILRIVCLKVTIFLQAPTTYMYIHCEYISSIRKFPSDFVCFYMLIFIPLSLH